MFFAKSATLLSFAALICCTTALGIDGRDKKCADVCTNPPPSCADQPALCCCVPEPVTTPYPTPTKVCTSVVGKPTGACGFACPKIPPKCSDQPGLCCCIPDTLTVPCPTKTPPPPPPTKSCSSLIGKPTGICADVCTNPPPKCSKEPGLCCCVPDVVLTTCAPQPTTV